MQERYDEEVWDESTSNWVPVAPAKKPSDGTLALERLAKKQVLDEKENRDDRRVPAARECHKECAADDKTYLACKEDCIEKKIGGPKKKPASKSRGIFARFIERGGRRRRTRKRPRGKKRTRRRRLPKKRHHTKTRRRR